MAVHGEMRLNRRHSGHSSNTMAATNIVAAMGRSMKGMKEPSLRARAWRSEASSVSPITLWTYTTSWDIN